MKILDRLSVPFQFQLPVKGPVSLELNGVRKWIPMQEADERWTVAVDLSPGVYLYRFRVGDFVVMGDSRRTTQRVVNGEVWSILHVTAEAVPAWIERPIPTVAAIQVCRGLTETNLPLLVLERVRQTDLPVILWVHVRHVYQDALLKVLLVRPDGDLAFGGEFALESSNASADFDLKFWLSLTVEPEHAMPGTWTFIVQAEGSPVVRHQVVLQLD